LAACNADNMVNLAEEWPGQPEGAWWAPALLDIEEQEEGKRVEAESTGTPAEDAVDTPVVGMAVTVEADILVSLERSAHCCIWGILNP
jgi:hypothetical protein